MSFEVAVLGLIIVPLAAGIAAVVAGRMAAAVTVVVGLIELLSSLQLAHLVSREGPLSYSIGGWGAPLGIELYADGLTALMLAMTALVASAVTIYAAVYFRAGDLKEGNGQTRDAFWPLSLFLWAALNALFLSGDIFTHYVTLELLTLSAVALIGLAGTASALTAALRYLLIALLASLFYLFGVALLYSAYGTVAWRLLGPQFQADLPGYCAVALMSVGLLLKTALFPLHSWLPAAHANAPAPASALLSALVLKGSFYLLLRLWFDVFPFANLQQVGHLLGMLGAAAVLWGSLQAIRQRRLKLLVAYSTVAQIGYLFLVFSLAAEPAASFDAWSATVLFAVAHASAKAAAFVAAGSLQYAVGSDRIDELAGTAVQQPATVLGFAVAGVSLVGLPPSGAFLAKWLLLESAIVSGRWELAFVVLFGGILAAVYVLRVLASSLAPAGARPIRRVPWVMQAVPLVLALATIATGALASPILQLLDVSPPFPQTSPGTTP